MSTIKWHSGLHGHRRRARGAASLVVVMLLFFIISMVAAYTSRNLIFEQRTSINQYRSTQALEAAEAGMEWTLAMFNQGLIDGSCTALSTAATGATSFRQRYLLIDDATGVYAPKTDTPPPTCVFDGSNWSCACAESGGALPAAPSGSGIHPAFRVRFEAVAVVAPTPPALIKVVVSACTRLEDDCLSTASLGAASEGRATVSSILSISGSLAAPPRAALTARGSVNLGSSPFRAESADLPSGGITVQAGGAIAQTPAWVLVGLPGTPPGTPGSATLIGSDSTLSDAGMTADRLFAAPFNIWPDTFRQQPAAIALDCGSADCTDSQVLTQVALHPRQPIWVKGNLAVGTDLGSTAAPLLLVINGDLKFTGGTPTVYGLVYLRTATWTTAGTGSVRGAVIAEGSVAGSASLTLLHDSDVLNRLRYGTGSLVRVPGSWKDFP